MITRVGGTAGAAIAPDLNNSYADEASVFVERAVLQDLGSAPGSCGRRTTTAGSASMRSVRSTPTTCP